MPMARYSARCTDINSYASILSVGNQLTMCCCGRLIAVSRRQHPEVDSRSIFSKLVEDLCTMGSAYSSSGARQQLDEDDHQHHCHVLKPGLLRSVQPRSRLKPGKPNQTCLKSGQRVKYMDVWS